MYRPLGTTQSVASGTSSAASTNGVGTHTHAVLIHSDQNAYIAFGASPTASSSDGTFIQASEPYYFSIVPGEKIAAIRVAVTGTVYISELTR
jgi:hypothetical protein|tara:strand:+ start:4722 stop:4997 length:276 start_codon:yes stop_codon:yes gene_type:complete